MLEFFKGWRRNAGVVALVMACSFGCANPVRTATLATDRPVVGYQVRFKNSNGNNSNVTGRKIEYRLNGDVMLVLGNGELRIDGKAISLLKESDIVTVEDSRFVLLNAVQIWPPEST